MQPSTYTGRKPNRKSGGQEKPLKGRHVSSVIWYKMWKTRCVLKILLSMDRGFGSQIQFQPDFTVMSGGEWPSKPRFSLACKMHKGCSSSCRRSHASSWYRVTSEIWKKQDKLFFGRKTWMSSIKNHLVSQMQRGEGVYKALSGDSLRGDG